MIKLVLLRNRNLYENIFIFLVSITFFNFFKTTYPLEWDSPIYTEDAIFHRTSVLGLGRIYFSSLNQLFLWLFVGAKESYYKGSLDILTYSSLIISSLTMVTIHQLLYTLKFSGMKRLASILFLLSSAPIIHTAINITPDAPMYLLLTIAVFNLSKFEHRKELKYFYAAIIYFSIAIGFKEQALIFQPIILLSVFRNFSSFNYKQLVTTSFLYIYLAVFPIYLFFVDKNFNQKTFDFLLSTNLEEINGFQMLFLLAVAIFIFFFRKYISLPKISNAIKKISFAKILFFTLAYSLLALVILLPFLRSLNLLITRYYFFLPFVILHLALFFSQKVKKGILIFVPVLIANSIVLSYFYAQNRKSAHETQNVLNFLVQNKRATLYFLYGKTSLLHYLSKNIPHHKLISFSWPGLEYDDKENKEIINKAFRENRKVMEYSPKDTSFLKKGPWEKVNNNRVLRHFRSRRINDQFLQIDRY